MPNPQVAPQVIEKGMPQPWHRLPSDQATLAAETVPAQSSAPTLSAPPLPIRSLTSSLPHSLTPSLPKRLSQTVLILLTTCIMLGAGNPANRFDKLGHSLMCTCGCGEILLECNHVGCPTSGPMIEELKSELATAATDKQIFHFFEAKYGATALAAPIRGGFDLVAWIMPFAVLALGLTAAIWLLRHWRDRHAQAMPNSALPSSEALRNRIRQETTYEP